MLTEAIFFLEALKEHREPKYGLLGDSILPSDPSGNALLYESHAAWMYMDLTGQNYPHEAFYTNSRLLCAASGLYYRKPLPAHDSNTHDDYVGLTSVSGTIARNVARRGLQQGWYYDCFSPETGFWKALKLVATRVEPFTYLDQWHGRFPGLPEHYLISSGVDVGIWGWTKWLSSIVWTIRKPGNESGWLLDYLKIRAANVLFPNRWAVRLANKLYKWRLNVHYNGRISSVYAAYFGSTHPFARWSAWPGPRRG